MNLKQLTAFEEYETSLYQVLGNSIELFLDYLLENCIITAKEQRVIKAKEKQNNHKKVKDVGTIKY